MKPTSSRLLLLLLLLAPGGMLPAQAPHQDPVVYADQKTIGEDALRAAGNVEVLWQDYVIYADAIDFNLKTRELFAEGRVTMAARDMVISGEKLVFNLKTQQGEMLDAEGMASPVVRFSSDRLQQIDRETLAFRRLDFTSCAQVFPRWRISSRKGRIKKDRYIKMHGALLRVKNVPLFYLPYMRYPLHKDGRATGLLFPGIGHSELRGFFLQNAFFWALRPNIDMTLGLDFFSRLGVGASNEVRYLLRNARGSARAYYFRYRQDNGVYQGSNDDYFVEAEHQQSLPLLNTKLRLNVNLQSRPDFLRLLDNSFDMVKSANFQSALSLTSSFANVQASVSASRRETYYVNRNSSLVVEQLPVLSLNLNQQKLGKFPGYFSLAANFLRTRRSGVSYEEDPEFSTGLFSQRLTLTPSFQLPLLKLSWLSSSLDLSSRNSFYAKSRDAATGQVLDEPIYVNYHTAAFVLKGPVFSRIFGSGRRRLKHVIEPEFSVRYATEVANSERVVKVDRSDFPSFSYAGFKLTTRLLSRGGDEGASPGELLAYSVSQQYYFDPAEANYNLKIDGEYPRFSKLSQQLRFRPGGSVLFDAVLDYNHYLRDLTLLNLRASYNRPGSPLTGSLSYSVYRNPYQPKDFDLNRRVLGAGVHFDHPGFPLKLESRLDYDFSEDRLLHGSLNAGFDYQCLYFNTEFKMISWLGKSYFQFRFGVSLGNLGMVGDFFGGK